MRLKKLTERMWAGNYLSPRPSSWQVDGAAIFMVGLAGSVPSYDVYIGGQFDYLRGVIDGRRVATGQNFASAKRVAKQYADAEVFS